MKRNKWKDAAEWTLIGSLGALAGAGVVLLAVLIKWGLPLLVIVYFGHLIEAWCLPTNMWFIPDDSTCRPWMFGGGE